MPTEVGAAREVTVNLRLKSLKLGMKKAGQSCTEPKEVKEGQRGSQC